VLSGNTVSLIYRRDTIVAGAIPSNGPNRATKRKYDGFFSSVLAGFADDSRLLHEKKTALAIVKCLEQECSFTVYYAGRDVQSISDFDGSHLGAKQDITALN
jgi:hypothetical protein